MTGNSWRSHTERTAAEPRQAGIHKAQLTLIRRANPRIRLLTLTLPYALHFLPGQWLDVYIPSVTKAGGFTITSPPSQALNELHGRDARQYPESQGPHLELAVQESPRNPSAAWLWQSEEKILGTELQIRIGGRFTWPPPGLDVSTVVEELVLIAGGVGINPFMSILSHLYEQVRVGDQRDATEHVPQKLTLLYGTKSEKDLNGVLFYPRIHRMMSGTLNSRWSCHMFLSGTESISPQLIEEHTRVEISNKRMADEDVLNALRAPEARARSVAYVCGPQSMTDHFVDLLRQAKGMAPERVLCEKWW